MKRPGIIGFVRGPGESKGRNMENLAWIVVLALGIYAFTAWVEKKKADRLADSLQEALSVISGFSRAIEAASSEHPMLIASAKSAKDLADKLAKVYEVQKKD